ncbi:4-hydroxyphenylacetate decarboxylase activase [Collinsella vaginalis]|uniref:4-hydroxyphenylacetate decarboxylase activase n=1 Tax=Collinsella vaginalis TaxID=1870987 RepID=UPI001C4FD28F|nr:4-hydroxyphenylacetate decarboxylase activase [Collinsella vaginalis]
MMNLSAPFSAGEKRLKGRIFDIQAYSVHDGPGCRSTVFLAGCPFRCAWCCNPESFQNRQGKLYRATQCINSRERPCTRCADACPYGAVNDTADTDPAHPIRFDQTICQRCTTFECVDSCLVGALEHISKEYTVDELMGILSRDRHYWSGNGGVTFSGGDPMMQSEFLIAVLKRCREAYIHTAIETEGAAETETYLKVMEHISFAFNDLKHMDPEKHREFTGASNERVLANIRALASSNWPGRLVLRAPVIEGFNDTEENFHAVGEFMNELGLTEFNMLPFHRLGVSKWEQLGMEYAYADSKPTDREKLLKLKRALESHGVSCYVGNDTPF